VSAIGVVKRVTSSDGRKEGEKDQMKVRMGRSNCVDNIMKENTQQIQMPTKMRGSCPWQRI
jgi:hypothetical protein